MTVLSILGVLLLSASTAIAQGSSQRPSPGSERLASEGCIVCHGEQGVQMRRSVHAQVGLTCVSCHGGRPDAMDQTEAHGDDLRLLDDPAEAVDSCGNCHSDPERMRPFGQRTDQLALYWTSRHGQRLAEDGAADVATCVSCHGAHGVFKATDPRSTVHRMNQVDTCSSCHADAARMAPYGLDADGPEQYRRSVHGQALLGQGRVSSPACADCHGSHGAAPPRVEDAGEVCGSCHAVARGYFEESAHMRAVSGGKMGECVSCHGSHLVLTPTAAMFRGDAEGHCGACHDGGVGVETADALYEGLKRLEEMIAGTEQELALAAADGLFIERENGYLDDARGLRARARALTHSLSPEALQDLENRCAGMVGQTLESLAVKNRALRDRKIFTSIFLLVVVVLAAVLMVYRREISGGWEPRVDWSGVVPGAGTRIDDEGGRDA